MTTDIVIFTIRHPLGIYAKKAREFIVVLVVITARSVFGGATQANSYDRSMTGLMELDLSPQADDALLMPFRRSEPSGGGESTVRRAGPQKRDPLSRLFRRRASNEANVDQQSSLLPKSTDEWRTPEHDGEELQEIDERSSDDESDVDEGSSSDSEDESDEEDSGDDSDGEQNRGDRSTNVTDSSSRNHERPRVTRIWGRNIRQNQGLLSEDALAQKASLQTFKLDGFGSASPLPDPRQNAIGRFFRRIVQRPDLKSMKIATEGTKDERNFSESLSHAVALAVTPVELIEDENQEQTLGYYRTVNMDVEEEENESAVQKATSKAVHWRNETKCLLAKVEALEMELKNSQLEVTSWKARAKELRRELRELRGEHVDDDDSSAAVSQYTDDEDESSAGTEEVLLDMTVSDEEPQFDPLATIESSTDASQGLLKLSVGNRELAHSDGTKDETLAKLSD